MIKPKTNSERRWLHDVASLGCVCCRNLGLGESPAEIHHVREGNGMSQRASHFDVIPLCPPHHRASFVTGFHANRKKWETIHGAERELLEQTKTEVRALRDWRIGGGE